MKTPEILIPALRQHASNTGSGELFASYDYDTVNEIVSNQEKEISKLKAHCDILVNMFVEDVPD